jgi:hypothetical protein
MPLSGSLLCSLHAEPMQMLLKSRHVWLLARHFGIGWLIFRIRYALHQRRGWFARRWPVTTWEQRPFSSFLTDLALADPVTYKHYRLQQAPRFLFDPAHSSAYAPLLCQWDAGEETPQQLATQLMAGRWRFFERHWFEIGSPPNWRRNALTGEETPADRHWSRISDFGHGDIKVIWEPNRFGWVYALVRAYWRTGDELYAEHFWQLLEDWRTHNLPYQGVNWRCGQETTFRVMAWCFALYGFAASKSSTPARVQQLCQMIALSGERIASNLEYALSQRNNHGVSEGVGLWTIGVLFPELEAAARWRKRGRQVLEQLAQDLIADDGAFSQHSMNYHRVMLHDYLWALQLGEHNENPLSKQLRERVRRSAQFLHALLEPTTGRMPNYGANDGALVLPLTNCNHRDYRPVIQAALWVTEGMRTLPPGAWDEELLWLGGLTALAAVRHPSELQPLQAESSGYYTMHDVESSIFVRCDAFAHRPSHADLLHVDLWHHGHNIAIDPGTYSYNAPPPWDDPLSCTTYHNTVTVDGLEQMERVSRFLWLPWAKGKMCVQKCSERSLLAYWEGEHDGYQRLPSPVAYRRAVVALGAGTWLVLDDLHSVGDHSYRLHWLFDDFPYTADLLQGRLALSTASGLYDVQWGALNAKSDNTIVRAMADNPRGWQAPYYLERTPALSLAAVTAGNAVRFWTLFSPASLTLQATHNRIHLIGAAFEADVLLAAAPTGAIVSQIILAKPIEDSLAPCLSKSC